ncbi:hypothetical protein pb186bvf_004368 [Paramecium bursaria]
MIIENEKTKQEVIIKDFLMDLQETLNNINTYFLFIQQQMKKIDKSLDAIQETLNMRDQIRNELHRLKNNNDKNKKEIFLSYFLNISTKKISRKKEIRSQICQKYPQQQILPQTKQNDTFNSDTSKKQRKPPYLDVRIIENMNSINFKCLICKRIFKDRIVLVIHQKKYHGLKIFSVLSSDLNFIYCKNYAEQISL